MNICIRTAASTRQIGLSTIGGLLAFIAVAAANLTVTGTTNELALADALLAADGGGISNLTVSLIAHSTNAAMSSGTYTVTKASDTYGLGTDGIVLSTGNVADYSTGPNHSAAQNTSYGAVATVGQNALLSPISGTTSNFDATTLALTFDVNPGITNVCVSFVFGSEEFPEGVLAEKDGFGIYFNGVNVALLDGAVITSRHPAMTAVNGTELDGVLSTNGTQIVKLTIPVTGSSTNNTLTFIIGDSNDDLTDSTVYLTALGQGSSSPVSGVDLSGESSDVSSKCKEKNGVTCQVKGRLLIHNTGPDVAPTSQVKFYLSNNNALDEGDELVGEVATGTIKPGKPKTKTVSIKSNAAVSGRFLIAVIDATGVVSETNENNNVVVFGPLTDQIKYPSPPHPRVGGEDQGCKNNGSSREAGWLTPVEMDGRNA